MKRKYAAILIIVLVVGTGSFLWNHFINPDPVSAELKQMVTDSASSTFSVKKWEEADRYSKKQLNSKRKMSLCRLVMNLL